ncbi:MAG: hypothetical protein HKN85_11600 [Gammaproteobacteria bacterium]|nr:hypothetical protein [Gammaproteobacteria bacterium]
MKKTLTFATAVLMLTASGSAWAASRYDKPLDACATAIQEKLSISADDYGQSIDKVRSGGGKYKFVLDVYKKSEGGNSKQSVACEVNRNEVTSLEVMADDA